MRNLADRLPPIVASTIFAIFMAACSVSDLGLTDESIGSAPTSLDPADPPDLGFVDGEEADGTAPGSETTDRTAAEGDDVGDADGVSAGGADGTDSDPDDPGPDPDDTGPEGAPDRLTPEEIAAAERQLSTDPDVSYSPGSCHQSPTSGAAPVEVGCHVPHTIEVYAIRQLPGAEGADYLGLAEATELCDQDFTAITGVGIGLATVFNRSVLRPSEATWAAGEREVVCYVSYPSPTVQLLTDLDPVRAFGRVSIYGLRKGDCLIDFSESATSFQLADCGVPHDAEVFVESAFDVTVYPGDAAVDEIADQLCFGQSFEDYVGLDYQSSAVYSLRSRPSEETWSMGDRTINCILTDELVRTESFEGSGL